MAPPSGQKVGPTKPGMKMTSYIIGIPGYTPTGGLKIRYGCNVKHAKVFGGSNTTHMPESESMRPGFCLRVSITINVTHVGDGDFGVQKGRVGRLGGDGTMGGKYGWFFLGSGTNCVTDTDTMEYGMYICNLPLFDYTYPTNNIYRPSQGNGRFLTLPQDELPEIMRRAEYIWAPPHQRHWEREYPRYVRPRLRDPGEASEPWEGEMEIWEEELTEGDNLTPDHQPDQPPSSSNVREVFNQGLTPNDLPPTRPTDQPFPSAEQAIRVTPQTPGAVRDTTQGHPSGYPFFFGVSRGFAARAPCSEGRTSATSFTPTWHRAGDTTPAHTTVLGAPANAINDQKEKGRDPRTLSTEAEPTRGGGPRTPTDISNRAGENPRTTEKIKRSRDNKTPEETTDGAGDNPRTPSIIIPSQDQKTSAESSEGAGGNPRTPSTSQGSIASRSWGRGGPPVIPLTLHRDSRDGMHSAHAHALGTDPGPEANIDCVNVLPHMHEFIPSPVITPAGSTQGTHQHALRIHELATDPPGAPPCTGGQDLQGQLHPHSPGGAPPPDRGPDASSSSTGGGRGPVFLNEMVQPPPTAWAGVGNVLRHASRSLRSSEINYRSTEARDWVDPLMAIMCPWANVGEGVENAPRFTHFGPENRQPPPAQNARNESGDQASSSTNLLVRNQPAISPYQLPPSNDGNLRDRSSSSPPAPPMPSLGGGGSMGHEGSENLVIPSPDLLNPHGSGVHAPQNRGSHGPENSPIMPNVGEAARALNFRGYVSDETPPGSPDVRQVNMVQVGPVPYLPPVRDVALPSAVGGRENRENPGLPVFPPPEGYWVWTGRRILYAANEEEEAQIWATYGEETPLWEGYDPYDSDDDFDQPIGNPDFTRPVGGDVHVPVNPPGFVFPKENHQGPIGEGGEADSLRGPPCTSHFCPFVERVAPAPHAKKPPWRPGLCDNRYHKFFFRLKPPSRGVLDSFSGKYSKTGAAAKCPGA